MWSQNSWENNLFLLNRLPALCPQHDEEARLRFFQLLKKFTCSSYLLTKLRISRSWLFKKINSLSFSIKSMLENREPLFFTESRQYIRSAPWTRVKWLWNLYRWVKGPSCRRIKWYISDNSLLYPRCHACSIEPSLVDNLLLKMQPPVCRRQRSDVKRGTEKCAFKSCGDDIKFSKYQSAFLR